MDLATNIKGVKGEMSLIIICITSVSYYIQRRERRKKKKTKEMIVQIEKYRWK